MTYWLAGARARAPAMANSVLVACDAYDYMYLSALATVLGMPLVPHCTRTAVWYGTYRYRSVQYYMDLRIC
eukprot:COSAG01_NODE_570_length_15328_cov_82.520783_6_plen_71_part_00